MNMKGIVLATLLSASFWAGPALVHSETGLTIEGRVSDSYRDGPLKNVVITITGTRSMLNTDSSGHYMIPGLEPGVHQLVFSLPGYQTAKIKLTVSQEKPDERCDVRLRPIIYSIKGMVVTATRRAALVQNTPGVNYIIDDLEIAPLHSASASDLMDYVPGLDVETGSGVGAPNKKTVSINGTPSFHNIVLVDGKRLLSSHYHTGTDVNLVPTDNIERIEVIQDASCALYGSDAIGGVVNIITRRGGPTPSITFNTAGGSGNTVSGSLSASGPAGTKAQYSVYAGWDQSDGMPIEVSNSRSGRLKYKQFCLMDRVDIAATDRIRTGVSMHYLAMNDLMGRLGDNTKYDAFLFTPGVDVEARMTESLTLSGLAYYSQWNADLSLEKNEIACPQLWLTYTGIQKHAFTGGGEYTWRNFSRTGVKEKSQTFLAVFAQDEYTASDKLRFLAAVRSDYVDNDASGAVNTGPVLSPKLAVLYRPVSPVVVRAGFGLGFRAPLVQDLFESRSHSIADIGGIWRLGNQNLKAEYSNNLNGGLEINLAKGLSVLAHGYYYRLKDMIALVACGRDTTYLNASNRLTTVPMYQRQNVDNYIIKTIEAGGRYTLSHILLSAGGSATWQKAGDPNSTGLIAVPGQAMYAKLIADYPLNENISVNGFIGLHAALNRKAPGGDPLKNYQDLEAGFGGKISKNYEVFIKGQNLLKSRIDMYEDALYTIQGIRRYSCGLKISVF
jgi:outer membrane receptor for ferrienterochelin and colicins